MALRLVVLGPEERLLYFLADDLFDDHLVAEDAAESD
jgi:hypothetical protein